LQVEADGQPLATVDWQHDPAPPPVEDIGVLPGERRSIEGTVAHAGGPLHLVLRAASDAGATTEAQASSNPVGAGAPPSEPATIWMSDIRVEPDPR
jgi:Flp pilus assembly protein CpaB